MKTSLLSAAMLAAGLLLSTAAQATTLAEPMDETTYSLALHEAVTAQPVIESFVAPPSVFPSEGFWGSSRDIGPKEPYRPVEAYDSVGGKVIGRVVVVKPHCLVEGERPTGCDGAGQVFLNLQDGRQRVLPVEMWEDGTKGLITGKPTVVKGPAAWSEIAYAGGTFWLRTAPQELHPYEASVSYIERLETWCEAPGKCAPASPVMLAAWKTLEGHAVNPAGAVYEVAERVVHKGKAYYRVKRAELEEGFRPLGLPETGFVPTRDKAGKHIGGFSPIGC